MTTIEAEKCLGSGQRPLERVIMDVVPGVEPVGTCPVCKRTMQMDFYRMPEHDA
jgi:hypothetical protein